MVTTAGKFVISIGLIVTLTGLFVSMSTLVGLFMIFAGIITMIQGANMKPIETRAPAKADTTGSHYSTGLGTIKRDPNSKGIM